MASKTCKGCGHWPVAYDAVCCPNCGSRDPHTSKLMYYVGAILLMLVALGVIASGNGLLGLLMLIGGVGSLYSAWQR